MIRKQKTPLIVAAVLVIAVLICGAIGYMNDPRFASKSVLGAHATSSRAAAFILRLNYCYSDAPSVCVVSFGQDQAGSALIVIRNDNLSWKQLFLRTKQGDVLQPSVCQQVQFSNNIYYCTVSKLSEGADIRIEVYTADDNILIASGLLAVSFNATPAPKDSDTPAPQYATATLHVPTQYPTLTRATTHLPPTRVSATKTPSYPNP